jgi:hypothetical protein
MDAPNGLAEQPGGGQNLDLLTLNARFQWDRVRQNQFADGRIIETFDGVAGKQTVGTGGVNFPGAFLAQFSFLNQGLEEALDLAALSEKARQGQEILQGYTLPSHRCGLEDEVGRVFPAGLPDLSGGC